MIIFIKIITIKLFAIWQQKIKRLCKNFPNWVKKKGRKFMAEYSTKTFLVYKKKNNSIIL